MIDKIDSFSGPHRFLSNFHTQPFDHDGVVARTAEHHFQAAKTADPQARALVLGAFSPGRAKQLGRTVQLRPDWEETKAGVMASILRSKFSDPTLAVRLLTTGGAELVEGNTWHDQVWGQCTCPQHRGVPGQNLLGKALMALREELRTGLAASALPREAAR